MTSDLFFEITGVQPVRFAAVPTLSFGLRIVEASGTRVHSIVLRSQIRIEPQRRTYNGHEENGLFELFGQRGQWSSTLQPFPWTQVTTAVPGFEDQTDVKLDIGCSYELEVASAKYLHSLGDDGEVPLLFLFNGSVFLRGPGGIEVEQLPWHHEARYRLPVRVWRELMDAYYPNSGWLRLDRDTLDALRDYKARHAIPTWDGAVSLLLASAEVHT